MTDKRFALLIDADNISAKYISAILDEMTKHGIVTYKRIYGDWTSTQTNKWKNTLLENSVTPIQQFSNTSGKNATDSALIIDAMDILYTGTLDGFCIVSSDGDFTRLASRLRESGMSVIGMGEEKTPRSFRAACTVFTNLEVLIEQDEEPQKKKPQSKVDTTLNLIDRKVIELAITDIINGNADRDRETGLGELGSRLVNKHPDFDVRTYGYTVLSKFLASFDNLEMKKTENTIIVSLKDHERSEEEVDGFICDTLESLGEEGCELGQLGNLVHERFPGFNVKDFGYSQFSKYIRDIIGITLSDDRGGATVAYYREED